MRPGLPDRLAACFAPLALLVALLLFLQWPLRDAIGRGATQASDLAQWLFALYVALAVVAAQRRGAHLVAPPDLAAHGAGWRRRGAALCVLPWALYVAVQSAPAVWRSLVGLERFPETSNPGYFAVKLALWLLAVGLALQAAAELAARRRA